MFEIKKDRYGILRQATELMPKIKCPKDVKRSEAADALKNLDAEYEAVLKDMLNTIKNKVNGNEVKTADDLLHVFRDSIHAIGGIMTRCEIIGKPLIEKPVTDRASYKKAIEQGTDNMLCFFEELDDVICYSGCNELANDAAYNAYSYMYTMNTKDMELLASMPVLLYADANKVSLNCDSVLALQSAEPVTSKVPYWSKHHPLLGYMHDFADESDGVTLNSLMRGFGFSDIREMPPCPKVKLNVDFVSIFADRLQRFYDSNRTENEDYYTVFQLKQMTHKMACWFTAYEDCDNTLQIYTAIRTLLDIADKKGTVIDTNDSEYCTAMKGAPLSNCILGYREELSGEKHLILKSGLMSWVEVIESLRLTDVLPGFDEIAERIRKLP